MRQEDPPAPQATGNGSLRYNMKFLKRWYRKELKAGEWRTTTTWHAV